MSSQNHPKSNLPSEERVCTCHPDDRPPECPHRYAASLCQDAYRWLKYYRLENLADHIYVRNYPDD